MPALWPVGLKIQIEKKMLELKKNKLHIDWLIKENIKKIGKFGVEGT